MRTREVIKILNGTLSLLHQSTIDFDHVHDYSMASKKAIKALEEIQQYREIGTVEECRAAVERDREKEPVIRKKECSDGYYCPRCDYVFIHKDRKGWFCGQRFKRCPACGQVMLWDLEKIKENTGDNADE